MQRLITIAALGLVVAVLGFLFLRSSRSPEGTGADAGSEGQQVNTQLKGQVTIDGSSTVYPVSEAIADAFADRYPNVKTPVGVSGTGGGFKRFSRGDTDISDASRHISWAEFARCRDNGVAFIEVPVAYDGLSVVVNPENDWVEQLTVEQLTQIFSEGGAQSWQDLDENWPDEPIKVYAPGTDSGTFDYFREVVVGDEGSMRSDMSTSEDDNVLVTGVAGGRHAIAFFGAAYYFNNKSKLRAVPIVNPETGEPVMPLAENVANGSYAPFSRPLFIYVSEKSLGRPEVRMFVEYYLEHAAEMAERVDYVALPDELYERARKHVDQRHTGTHFWKPGGEERDGALPEIYNVESLVTAEPQGS